MLVKGQHCSCWARGYGLGYGVPLLPSFSFFFLSLSCYSSPFLSSVVLSIILKRNVNRITIDQPFSKLSGIKIILVKGHGIERKRKVPTATSRLDHTLLLLLHHHHHRRRRHHHHHRFHHNIQQTFYPRHHPNTSMQVVEERRKKRMRSNQHVLCLVSCTLSRTCVWILPPCIM